MPDLALIITCEHGGSQVPPAYRHLFRGAAATLASHRGWDKGALEVAERLACSLGAPLIATRVSRLLIDNNRSRGHRLLFSEFSHTLSVREKEAVARRYYQPHREAVVRAVESAMAGGRPVLHLAIHSFTPVLNGTPRKAGLGLLYDPARTREQRFCREWQAGLEAASPGLAVRRNSPYRGRSDGLATWLRRRYPEEAYLGIEVEINQGLLTEPGGSEAVAGLLGRTLAAALGRSSSPTPATGEPGDEIVAIVDADNRVVGEASRREMRRRNLIHRATYILVFNRRGRIFVQKRTTTKDIYPGYYDVAAGGVVLSNETYEESARRELLEELGIEAELECLGDRYFADDQNRVWGRIYRCVHDGPFVLQAAEVESGEFMTVAEILAPGAARFTPDGLAILAALGRELLPARGR